MSGITPVANGVAVIDTRNQRDLSSLLLDGSGTLKSVPAKFFETTTKEERALFGHQYGIYGFITDELIEWLSTRINGRSAIEVGAGNGGLAAALKIPATDNKMQDDPIIAAAYKAAGQQTAKYGLNVQRLDANEAVETLKPQVVVASWLTHRYDERRHKAGGNAFGPSEEAILANCEEYIFIGNEQVHAGKAIWSAPHQILYPDWLYSRAFNPTRNFIAVWQGEKS